ncbi:MAG: DNA primase, partial [Bacteroidales bacterium]|nr:DNA primase [Bacteroidales bacterium]
NKYHIEIEEKEETPEEIASRLRHESLSIVMDYAQNYYQEMLWDAQRSKLIGLSYFRDKRGFTDETIRKFGLGYAPAHGKSFSATALEAGYKQEYLTATGLSVERENGGLGDFFYDRVMFPIHSLSGKVIAFGGRILITDKKLAKYKNSPETELYVKNRNLYGIYFAKNAIARNDACLLVEGYTDVISMHQAGIQNVVASSGTSLTVGQINLIKRFTSNITVFYDGDAAGIKASVRGIDMILAEGMHVKVVTLPVEHDPDSFARTHTKEEIMDHISANAVDFITFKTNLIIREIGNDPYKRTELVNDIIKTISVIPDQIERNVYVNSVAEKFNLQQESIFRKIKFLREKAKEEELRRKELERAREQYLQHKGQVEGPQDSSDNAPDAEEYYEPVGESVYSAGPEAEPIRDEESGIVDQYLAVCEKELVYHLLKFGEYPMYSKEDMMVDPSTGKAKAAENILVADYIRNELSCDSIEFVNPLYRTIFNEYFSLDRTNPEPDKYEEMQARIIRHFTNHSNQLIVKHMISVISEDHPLTIKNLRMSVTAEEHNLGRNVPRSVTHYRYRIIAKKCQQLSDEIKAAEKENDSEKVLKYIGDLQTFNTIRNLLQKELDKI